MIFWNMLKVQAKFLRIVQMLKGYLQKLGQGGSFYYEYHGLFGRESISAILSLAGFKLERIQSVFGGQYLWIEAVPSDATPAIFSSRTKDLVSLTKIFKDRAEAELVATKEKVWRLAKKGKLTLWGAGAKGVMLANMVDPDACVFDCVVDVNPRKQGGYLPGTGHAIVSSRELLERGGATVVSTNSNYKDEIRQTLHEMGITVDVTAV